MVYLTTGKDIEMELRLLVQNLKGKDTMELLSLLDGYNEYVGKSGAEMQLLAYIKDYA